MHALTVVPDPTQPLMAYDLAVAALAECRNVDDVLKLHDYAERVRQYARQAGDTSLKRMAAEFVLESEFRAGELLRKIPRGEGVRMAGKDPDGSHRVSHGVTPEESPYAATLRAANISRQTAARYQHMSLVPRAVFEKALHDPTRIPTQARILATARPPLRTKAPARKGSGAATWVCAVARAFEGMGLSNRSPAALVADLTPAQRSELHRIAPSMVTCFQQLFDALDEESGTTSEADGAAAYRAASRGA